MRRPRAYAYRDGGIDAIQPKPRLGRVPKLSRDREAQLKARLDAGPRPDDGACTLGGKDIVRILAAEFGVKHTLGVPKVRHPASPSSKPAKTM